MAMNLMLRDSVVVNCFAPRMGTPFREADLIPVISLHFLAGLVAGSIFAVRTLLTLVALVLVECVGVAIWSGFSAGLFWLLGSLVAVQFGYLGGIYLRSVLERAGIGTTGVHRRRYP
jgi:hypothetical protein